jgi:hypothetical protein
VETQGHGHDRRRRHGLSDRVAQRGMGFPSRRRRNSAGCCMSLRSAAPLTVQRRHDDPHRAQWQDACLHLLCAGLPLFVPQWHPAVVTAHIVLSLSLSLSLARSPTQTCDPYPGDERLSTPSTRRHATVSMTRVVRMSNSQFVYAFDSVRVAQRRRLPRFLRSACCVTSL